MVASAWPVNRAGDREKLTLTSLTSSSVNPARASITLSSTVSNPPTE